MKTVSLNAEEFPGRIAHADAFRYFLKEMHARQYGPDEMIQAWNFFLAGWKAKAVQWQNITGKHRR